MKSQSIIIITLSIVILGLIATLGIISLVEKDDTKPATMRVNSITVASAEQILETAKDKVTEELDFSIVYINGKTRTLTVFVVSEEHVQPVIDLVGYVEGNNTHLEVIVDPYTND